MEQNLPVDGGLVHPRSIVELPDGVEAEPQIIHPTDPLGGINDAPLPCREDLSAGEDHHAPPGLFNADIRDLAAAAYINQA